MSEGVFITLIMIFLFGFCYAYSYGGEIYARKKEERAYKKKLRLKKAKEQGLNDLYAAKRLERAEKYIQAKERSKEIMRELARINAEKKDELVQSA